MRSKTTLVGIALALILSAASACSSDSGTATTATSAPGTSGASTTAGTTATTSGSSTGSTAKGPGSSTTTTTKPDSDAAINKLPISDAQKTCLKDKVNADPPLKAIAESTEPPTKPQALKFVNLLLSCMTKAELTVVLTVDQPDPDSPAGRCRTSKIAQLDEDQIAGFLSQDPATITALQPDFQQCEALTTSTTTR